MAAFPNDGEVKFSRDVDNEAESSLSTHNSLRGPYREISTGAGFPLCSRAPKSVVAGRYSRSLLSLGEGYPLWYPAGFKGGGRPQQHVKQGVSIGDVGFLEAGGQFEYLFNVFHPSTDHIQRKTLPKNFHPIEPPFHCWEIRRAENHFAPGTTLVSKGIQVDKTSSSPLKFRFTTFAQEGAILIFPKGGVREDLIVTHELYKYVREHAIDWYQCTNGYNLNASIHRVPNGTLYVITGTDKTNSWSTAVFPRRTEKRGRPLILQYDSEEIDPWCGTNSAETTYRSEEEENSGNISTVIIRGLRVGLSSGAWERNMAPVDRENVPFYTAPPTPVSGILSEVAQIRTKLFGVPKLAFGNHPEIPYHPSNLLLQILLEKPLEPVVAVIHDEIWCSAIKNRDVTYPALVNLMSCVFKDNRVVAANGLAKLIPLSLAANDIGDHGKNDRHPYYIDKILAFSVLRSVREAMSARAEMAYFDRTIKFLVVG